MAYLAPRVYDYGLVVLQTETTHFYICKSEPKSFDEAVQAMLGSKRFVTGSAFGPPETRYPSGRKITAKIITDGPVTGDGMATSWAAVDTQSNRLLAAGKLATRIEAKRGRVFLMDAFSIEIPGPVEGA